MYLSPSLSIPSQMPTRTFGSCVEVIRDLLLPASHSNPPRTLRMPSSPKESKMPSQVRRNYVTFYPSYICLYEVTFSDLYLFSDCLLSFISAWIEQLRPSVEWLDPLQWTSSVSSKRQTRTALRLAAFPYFVLDSLRARTRIFL